MPDKLGRRKVCVSFHKKQRDAPLGSKRLEHCRLTGAGRPLQDKITSGADRCQHKFELVVTSDELFGDPVPGERDRFPEVHCFLPGYAAVAGCRRICSSCSRASSPEWVRLTHSAGWPRGQYLNCGQHPYPITDDLMRSKYG